MGSVVLRVVASWIGTDFWKVAILRADGEYASVVVGGIDGDDDEEPIAVYVTEALPRKSFVLSLSPALFLCLSLSVYLLVSLLRLGHLIPIGRIVSVELRSIFVFI